MLYYCLWFMKIRIYRISKKLKFPSVDHALDDFYFFILFCLPLNITQTYTSLIKGVHFHFYTVSDMSQAGDEL